MVQYSKSRDEKKRKDEMGVKMGRPDDLSRGGLDRWPGHRTMS